MKTNYYGFFRGISFRLESAHLEKLGASPTGDKLGLAEQAVAHVLSNREETPALSPLLPRIEVLHARFL